MVPTRKGSFSDMATAIRRSNFKGSKSEVKLANAGTLAPQLMEAVQEWIDAVDTDHPLRRSALHLILHLTNESGRFSPAVLAKCDEGELVMKDEPFAKGAFGILYEGEYCGTPVVIKHILGPGSAETGQKIESARKEVATWRQLRHKNILEFIGVDGRFQTAKSGVHIITPLVKGSTLMDFMEGSLSRQNRSQALGTRETGKNSTSLPHHRHSILSQVAHALHYLHSQKVIHGDISGNNILIQLLEDTSIQVQLCDFGLTVVGNDTAGRVATTLDPRTTGDWMAPERQNGRRLDTPVDVYAFGCVCYAMCTGRPPQPSIAKKIAKGDHSAYPPEDGSGVPVCRGLSDEEYWEMAGRCWHISPQHRPSMATILAYLGEMFEADSETQIPGTQPRTLLCIAVASGNQVFHEREKEAFLDVLEGAELHIYDMMGDVWLARDARPEKGSVGYVMKTYVADPVYFKARVTQASASQKLQELPPKLPLPPPSRWLTREDAQLPDLTVKKDEEVDVVTVGRRRWVIRNKKGVIGYIDSLHLKVAWPQYKKNVKNVLTAKVVCTPNTNLGPHTLSFVRDDILSYLDRKDDWVIAWARPGTKQEVVGLIPITHMIRLYS